MTAPDLASAADLEEIIRNAVECTPYWVADKPETHQDPYENAARAVVAALEAVGSVEWGVENEGEVIPFSSESAARLSAAARRPARYVVSRVTGPWTRAE